MSRTRSKAARLFFWSAALLLVAASIMALLPSIPRDGDSAWRVKCASNLRQIGIAMELYAKDHQGNAPDSFATLLSNTDLVPEVFLCSQGAARMPPNRTAFTGSPADCDYVYLADGVTLPASADTILAIERDTNHEDGNMNVLFGDGRVEWMPRRGVTTKPADHDAPWWTAVHEQILRNERPVRLAQER